MAPLIPSPLCNSSTPLLSHPLHALQAIEAIINDCDQLINYEKIMFLPLNRINDDELRMMIRYGSISFDIKQKYLKFDLL